MLFKSDTTITQQGIARDISMSDDSQPSSYMYTLELLRPLYIRSFVIEVQYCWLVGSRGGVAGKSVRMAYAQVCVRLSVVSNTNFLSVSDDIRILAYQKARGN
jgi:hypothetical protein